MSDAVRDAGFDDWFDALERGEPYYLECPKGHGSLPPRGVCPDCGATELTETALSPVGEVETFTVTTVATPAFADETPYAVVIADFGAVRLTGQLREGDVDDLETGMAVTPDVGRSATTGDRVLVFRRQHSQ